MTKRSSPNIRQALNVACYISSHFAGLTKCNYKYLLDNGFLTENTEKLHESIDALQDNIGLLNSLIDTKLSCIDNLLSPNANLLFDNDKLFSINLIIRSHNLILHSCIDKFISHNNNFNMLNLDLQHIFKARGIDKPYTFLVKAGFTPHTATSICSSSTRTFKLDHIELLCKALVCEPNDLLSYTANKNEVLQADHPLLKLQHTDIEQNWRQTLATIPYNQLKELSKTIAKNE